MICKSLAIKGVLDRINVIHVQAIAELVDASSDLLVMIRDIDETRCHARTLSNWTRSLRLKGVRENITLEHESNTRVSRTRLRERASISRRWNDGSARRNSPRLYTKEAMEMMRDCREVYNAAKWTDAQSKRREKCIRGGG